MLCDGRVVVEGLVLPVSSCAGSGDFSRSVKGQAAVVDAGLVHYYHIFGGIENLFLAPGVLPAIAAVICDGCLAFLTILCSDEYYTVCSTGTVDCCRGCVFQNLDRFDISRVQIVDTAVYRHTVYYKQRVGVVDGADTADFDL